MEDVVHGPMESPAGPADFARLSYMCDNLILLEIERGDRLRRRISVYKTRGSGHDEAARDMTIDASGVHVQ
jgi:hypothetical protein